MAGTMISKLLSLVMRNLNCISSKLCPLFDQVKSADLLKLSAIRLDGNNVNYTELSTGGRRGDGGNHVVICTHGVFLKISEREEKKI